jgi:Fungal chitosanase of glycosyl hydrolase group 75
MDCDKEEQLKVGNVSVWLLQGQTAFFYEAGMAIDADGAPNAYHPEPDSNPGLDFLANAGSPGNWFGIVTDNGQRDGNPIIQGPDDPTPGFYVSLTSLQDRTKGRTDPLRYVDATQIPYMVLPPEVRSNLGTQLGDFAVVIRSKSGQLSEAIFVDVGPRGKIGEGN